ncbi:hypothetical protein AWB67_02621 [Caballeronia terrestris]|uniref:Uncharacterized protein n=1 Tax=Caballeronia terrestris TaxID=1226301 RepID=A0A158IME9_9BURK|nr:hypothetical protein AWB67_02621 [Caballeronia terrestris]
MTTGLRQACIRHASGSAHDSGPILDGLYLHAVLRFRALVHCNP